MKLFITVAAYAKTVELLSTEVLRPVNTLEPLVSFLSSSESMTLCTLLPGYYL